ncbi:extracellular solute-binding protein [Bacillus salipaludis]|uniref:Extracellular solute-binding protein n=1 Tax=Bacillus salipaludis TaxID=2547811 RepID=A0ABW8RJW8_9BACI
MLRNFYNVFILLICISLISVGCSNSSTSTNKNNTEEGLSGKLEIQYFVGGFGEAWWKEVIADFQKDHPDLEIVQHAGAKINEQMKPRWISNDPPDVVYIDGPALDEQQLVKDGQLLDITDWYKEAKSPNGQKISDLIVSQPKTYQEGKIYSVPIINSFYGLWYDKTLLEEKGWEEPTDFNSFLKVMEMAKNDGMYGLTYPGGYPLYVWRGLFEPAFIAEGGIQALEDVNQLKEGVFLSKPIQNGLAKIKQLVDNDLIDPGAVALDHMGAQMQHLQHKALFYPTGLWLPGEMAKDTPDNFKYGLVPPVVQDDGEEFPISVYPYRLAIAKEADNKEAAKEFVRFVFQEKYATSFVKQTQNLFNYKMDLSNVDGIESYVVESAEILENENVNLRTTGTAEPLDMRKVLLDATIAFLSNKISAKEWGERLEKEAKNIRND